LHDFKKDFSEAAQLTDKEKKQLNIEAQCMASALVRAHEEAIAENDF
jgi:hypothetical protein